MSTIFNFYLTTLNSNGIIFLAFYLIKNILYKLSKFIKNKKKKKKRNN